MDEEIMKKEIILDNIRTSKEIMNKIRPYFILFLEVLNENNIIYCADYGTLLGAIRDHNEICWDDDYDIFIFQSTQEIYNLNLTRIMDESIIKKFEREGKVLKVIFQKSDNIYLSFYECHNFIQVFAYDESFTTICKITDIFTPSYRPNIMKTQNEMTPLILKQFGTITIPVMKNYHEYLSSYYGTDYMTVCKVCNHKIASYYNPNNTYITVTKQEMDELNNSL